MARKKKILIILSSITLLIAVAQIYSLVITGKKGSMVLPTASPEPEKGIEIVKPGLPLVSENIELRDMMFKNIEFAFLGAAQKSDDPESMKEDVPAEKTSPDGLAIAVISSGNLIIRDSETPDKIINAELYKDTVTANFSWLDNDYLLLIEKENSDAATDRIYMVNRYNGKRMYMTQTLGIAGGLDLSYPPMVLDGFGKVLLTDTKANYWLLSFSY